MFGSDISFAKYCSISLNSQNDYWLNKYEFSLNFEIWNGIDGYVDWYI